MSTRLSALPVLLVVLTITSAVVGGRLGLRLDPSRRRGLLIAALVESSLLFAAALLARGYDSETLVPVVQLYSLIALTALAMGVRNATVRRLVVPDLTTTLAGGGNPRWRRRVASVAAMLSGAIVGGLLVLRGGLGLPLVLTGAITLVGTAVYVAYPVASAGS
jgi:uncharacterized membrane protein YoaK (UPF0700 family)